MAPKQPKGTFMQDCSHVFHRRLFCPLRIQLPLPQAPQARHQVRKLRRQRPILERRNHDLRKNRKTRSITNAINTCIIMCSFFLCSLSSQNPKQDYKRSVVEERKATLIVAHNMSVHLVMLTFRYFNKKN